MSCMNFQMIQVVIKCFERSTVERIEENSNTCPAVYLYDTQNYGHGEMRNKN